MKMKKTLWCSILLAIGLVSCNDVPRDEAPSIDLLRSMTDSSVIERDYNVSSAEARLMAQLLSTQDIRSIDPVVDASSDTTLYVVNYDRGWSGSSDGWFSPLFESKWDTGYFGFKDRKMIYCNIRKF